VIDWLVFLVLALAVARVTRLVTTDEVTLPLRTWVIRKWGEDGKAAYFIFCPWCVSIWVSMLLIPPTFLTPHEPGWVEQVWLALLAIGATSHLTGLIASKLEND
jgi:drug/metabolite transporter (DMT)-like permease